MRVLKIAGLWLWCVLAATVYQLLTFLLLDVPGFVLVPLAIWFGHEQRSITGKQLIFSAPRWLFPWGNQQEGYDSAFAVSLHPTWPRFWRRYVWAAWRNKSSNKRFIRWMNPPPDPERIGYIQFGPGTWLCWQGWLVNWQWARGNRWTEIGPRYSPSDKDGLAPNDWRRFGCGWAYRPWGRV